ncbi:MAG: sigma-70 family RNA polymerase sigma factor [Microbacteriaceae bacterium]|nr:sigma-70 family RNA polymerase sigma factor [Microbacteriaceae bacterium]
MVISKERALSEERRLRSLVERAANSDPDAWEKIFRRSHAKLFFYARRRTSSAHVAEEAVSETLMRAMEQINRFTSSGAGFDAWQFGIMRSVILEGYRSDAMARRDRYFVPEHSTRLDPLATVEVLDDAKYMRRAFSQLSRSEQEVLELRVVAELSSDGAAEVLGKNRGRCAWPRLPRSIGY